MSNARYAVRLRRLEDRAGTGRGCPGCGCRLSCDACDGADYSVLSADERERVETILAQVRRAPSATACEAVGTCATCGAAVTCNRCGEDYSGVADDDLRYLAHSLRRVFRPAG